MARRRRDSEEKDASRLGKVIDTMTPELVKKALFTGAGALLLTEEGIRKTMGDFNLPRDVVQYLVRQSEKSKKELYGIVQKELNRFLSAIDVAKQVREIVDGMTLEIDAKVKIRTGEGEIQIQRKGPSRPRKTTKRGRGKS